MRSCVYFQKNNTRDRDNNEYFSINIHLLQDVPSEYIFVRCSRLKFLTYAASMSDVTNLRTSFDGETCTRFPRRLRHQFVTTYFRAYIKLPDLFRIFRQSAVRALKLTWYFALHTLFTNKTCPTFTLHSLWWRIRSQYFQYSKWSIQYVTGPNNLKIKKLLV